jgi:hypothetical protein
MHPLRRIEEIKSTLDDGEVGTAEIRAAAGALERSFPVGEVLAAVADPEFPSALIDAAKGCPEDEERAWLTIAAAGARRARQVLAWRASQLLDPTELVALAMKRARARERGFEQLAATSGPDAAAAWALLAYLRVEELQAMVRARPALAAVYRRARAARGQLGAAAPCPALG